MKTAIDKLDDTELGGRRIRIEEDKPRSSRKRRYDIFDALNLAKTPHLHECVFHI